MSRNPRRALEALLVASLLMAAGCSERETSTAAPAAETPPPVATTVQPSRKGRVKFKGPRWATDLGRALELDVVCTEFGQLDCVKDVHRIALGGVEPYELNVMEPLPVAPIAATNAVDRVALSACIQRADADFAAADAAIVFGPLVDQTELTDTAVGTVVGTLYDRLLLRDPTAEEIAVLQTLAEDVRAESDAPTRDWAILSCFAVASSLEALFY